LVVMFYQQSFGINILEEKQNIEKNQFGYRC
jgi:hypothetical protein